MTTPLPDALEKIRSDLAKLPPWLLSERVKEHLREAGVLPTGNVISLLPLCAIRGRNRGEGSDE